MDFAVSDLDTNQYAESDGLSALIELTEAEARGEIAHWLRVAKHEQSAGRTEEARALLLAAAERFPGSAQVSHDLAKLAEARSGWAEAERHWRMFASLSPTVWWGLTHMSHALRQQRRTAEAEQAASEALRRFPHEVGVFLEYARVAESRKDVAEAAERWSTATERFPAVWEGWIGRAWALQRQGRAAEAEEILADAQRLLPNEARLFTDHAVLAEIRRDWPEAGARWMAVTTRFPTNWHGLTGQARVLRQNGRPEDAKILLTQAVERFPTQPEPLVELARLAETSQDWTEAERWWQGYIAAEPKSWWGYAGLANALKEQRRSADADAIVIEQFDRFQHEPGLFIAYARLADRSKDWPESLKRWEAVAERFPDVWDALGGQGRALRELRRYQEARALLEASAIRFPSMSAPLHDLARLAETMRDWTGAERWWREFLTLEPSAWWGYTGLASALHEQDRAPEADAVLCDQFERLAHQPEIFMSHATLAERARDWPPAEARWANVAARFPNRWEGYAGQARSLAQQDDSGRLTQADNLYRKAHAACSDLPHLLSDWATFRIKRLGHDFDRPLTEIETAIDDFLRFNAATADLLRNKAAIKRAVGNHKGAFETLVSATSLFPNDRALLMELASMQELLLDQEVNSASVEITQHIFQANKPSLFARFESLGGGGPLETGWGNGCEFGLIQRNSGAEPLGLLRWASIGPQNLIRALGRQLSDVGEPDSISISPHGNRWAATETNYDIMLGNTQLLQVDVSKEEARRRVSARLRFLARKLGEDLTLGEKIFVYRVFGRKLDETTVANLHNAVRAFGNGRLLYVTYADEHHPPGTVEMPQPGLLLGFIDWFSADREGIPGNFPGWKNVCEAALNEITV